MTSEVPRDELKAALAARRELGEEYESALVESFMEKIDQAVEARVQAQLAQAQSAGMPGAAARATAQASHQQFVLGIVSLRARWDRGH